MTSCARCEDLKQIFGNAPPCTWCVRRVAIEQLTCDGYAACPRGWEQAFKDCGIEPVRVRGVAEWVYVLEWQKAVVVRLINTHECGPILSKCTEDPRFREVIEPFLRCLPDPLDADALLSLRSFAESAGLDFDSFQPCE